MINDGVIDLHCDLLGSIDWSKGELNFESEKTNCSLIQLEDGGVRLQVLAVAALTNNESAESGENQVHLYQEMHNKYPNRVGRFAEISRGTKKLHCMFSIENASVLASDDEPLEKAFERFTAYNAVEKILYVSLTWNQENRFGGGNMTNIGLKEDGKTLLDFMSGKKVAIDFSHTSDQLAQGIFNYIDQKGLKIPVMASHSNFRSVMDHPRNLPDEFAKELIQRKGVIGLNFVKRFVGNSSNDFISHIKHGLSLGGENAICLGADFYGELDVPAELCPGRIVPPFFEDLPNSSCYPKFRDLLKKHFSKDQIDAIFYRNASFFLKIFR